MFNKYRVSQHACSGGNDGHWRMRGGRAGFPAAFMDPPRSPIGRILSGCLLIPRVRCRKRERPLSKKKNGSQTDAEGSRGGRRGECRNNDVAKKGRGVGEKEVREGMVTEVGGISDAWSVGDPRREAGKSWLHSQRGTGLLFGCWQRSKSWLEKRERGSGAEAKRCPL